MGKINVNAGRPVPEFLLDECKHRKLEITEACGSATYWWCYKKNCQINIYEDCPECKKNEEQISIPLPTQNPIAKEIINKIYDVLHCVWFNAEGFSEEDLKEFAIKIFNFFEVM